MKKPFSGPKSVIEYFARYTHKIAISNHRIVSCSDEGITIKYRDRKKKITNQKTFTPVEFIRRYLQHVIPKNFMRIRHFGFIANRCKKVRLAVCRKLLGLPGELPPIKTETAKELMLRLTGIDIDLYPFCKKGVMMKKLDLPELRNLVKFNNIKLLMAMENP